MRGHYNVLFFPCQQCSRIFCVRAHASRQRSPQFCSRQCANQNRALPLETRLARHTERTDSCWLWTGKTLPNGYGLLAATSRDSAARLAHRAAWETATGIPLEDGEQVLHTCDVRCCVRNDDEGIYEVAGEVFPRRGHLFLATQRINVLDMHAKGRGVVVPATERSAAVVRSGHARLTPAIARYIRSQVAQGTMSQRALAAQLGVSRWLIYKVVHGQAWAHVT